MGQWLLSYRISRGGSETAPRKKKASARRSSLRSFALFAAFAIIWGLGTFMSASGRTNHESDSVTKGDVEMLRSKQSKQLSPRHLSLFKQMSFLR